MKEVQYKDAVAKLMNPKLSAKQALLNWVCGLAGESAEIDELIGYTRWQCDLNRAKLLDELSDYRWYLTACGITMDSCAKNVSLPKNVLTGWQELSRQLMRYSGKLLDIVKKVVFHKHPLDKVHREMIEVQLQNCWRTYNALLSSFKIKDSQVTTYNYKKLSARYKNLKFTAAQSLNRKN
jgi:hypothetical protein